MVFVWAQSVQHEVNTDCPSACQQTGTSSEYDNVIRPVYTMVSRYFKTVAYNFKGHFITLIQREATIE